MTAVLDKPRVEEAPTETTTFFAIVDTKAFLAALKAVKPAVPSRTTLPVLSCALIVAANGDNQRMIVAATNLETSLNATVATDGISGAAAVPFKTLLGVVETLPAGDLTLSVTTNTKRNNATLHFSMENIAGEIVAFDHNEYPNIPNVYEADVWRPSPNINVASENPADAVLVGAEEGEAPSDQEPADEPAILASSAASDGTQASGDDVVAMEVPNTEQERTMETTTAPAKKTRTKAATPAAATPASSARLRYCLHNGKVEAFFDKALKAGVPVQLRTKHGTPHDMKDLVPVGKDGEDYILRAGKKQVRIPMAEPVYFQYVA